MTLAEVNARCMDGYAVLMVSAPDDFELMYTSHSVDDCVKCLDYCGAEGFERVFIYPCVTGDVELETREIARMFREMYGAAQGY